MQLTHKEVVTLQIGCQCVHHQDDHITLVIQEQGRRKVGHLQVHHKTEMLKMAAFVPSEIVVVSGCCCMEVEHSTGIWADDPRKGVAVSHKCSLAESLQPVLTAAWSFAAKHSMARERPGFMHSQCRWQQAICIITAAWGRWPTFLVIRFVSLQACRAFT